MKFEMNLKIEKPRYFTVSDITYAQVDAWFGHTTRDLKLDLIYPKLKNKKYPCIVWFCGGGWIRLDKSAHFAYLAKLALEGFAVASVEYRTSNEGAYPMPLEDVKAAPRGRCRRGRAIHRARQIAAIRRCPWRRHPAAPGCGTAGWCPGCDPRS